MVVADAGGEVLGQVPPGGDELAEFRVVEAQDLPFDLADRRLFVQGVDDLAERPV